MYSILMKNRINISSFFEYVRDYKMQDDHADISSADTFWLGQTDACVYTHRVKSAVGEVLYVLRRA
jgi:hypothetical protein